MKTIKEIIKCPVAVVAILLVAVVASACGSDENTTEAGSGDTSGGAQVECATGTIAGGGATFVQTIMQQWIKDFGSRCSGATVNYQAVGSGAGIQQFNAGTIDFAGSDVVMKADEESAAVAKHGPVLHIPWSAGGIAVEYNLSGVRDLKLTPAAVAGIFTGKITKWDDAAIKSENSGVDIPSMPIQVIHRSDGSGTTGAFTAFLETAAPSVWTIGSGKEVKWPVGQGAKGSDGVTAAVKQTEGAVGYSEVSFAKSASLGVAMIKNEAGSFVGPEGKAVSAALEDAEVPADLKVKIDYKPTSAEAYPISTTTFVIVPKTPTDAGKAQLLRAFITYALTEGQAAADGLFYAPLPDSLVDQAKTAVESIAAP